jgi:MFS transporter, DHA1 family, multidrug resistance protein
VTLPVGRPWFPALVLVTGVGPLATDAYLAGLPKVQHDLHTSSTVAQLTMTAFIIGLAVGQLVFGPISDGVGRRRLMLLSAATFAVASLCCAVAAQPWLLVAARLVEGVAGGSGVALGRAVISDQHEGAAAATRYGTLISITLIGPVIAPAIGGVILAVGSWRTVFWLLTAVGVAMVGAIWFGVPETLPPQRRHEHGLAESAGRMRAMLRMRAFVAPVVVQCLATAGFFTYIGGSSIVLHDEFGISTSRYATLFATNALAMAVAAVTFRLTVVRVGAVRLRRIGLGVSTGAAIALLCYAVAAGDSISLAPTWVLLAGMVAGNGLTIPATTTLAQEAGRYAGGTASALQGGLTFVVGAFATPLTGVTGHQSVLVMSLLSAGAYVIACALLTGFARRPGREPLLLSAGGQAGS